MFYPNGHSFDGWHGRWIDKLNDRALPMLARERLIGQANVGMTKNQIIGICGGRWTQQPFGNAHTFLRFEHLATQIELDANEIVVRIVHQSI